MVDLAVLQRVPRWVSVIFGLACVLVGAVAVVRPFTSLSALAALGAAALLVTGVMELAAGVLLRSEPFTRDVPPGARAWLILYTTRDTGVPAAASAIVVAPAHPPAGPRPVRNGMADGCTRAGRGGS